MHSGPQGRGAAHQERPPCGRASDETPLELRGREGRRWVNPPPGCGSSQHIPAASLGAVRQISLLPAATLYLCLTHRISTCNRLQPRSKPRHSARAAQPMPGRIFPCSCAFCCAGMGWLSIAPCPGRCLSFRQGFPSPGWHGGLERGQHSRHSPPTAVRRRTDGGSFPAAGISTPGTSQPAGTPLVSALVGGSVLIANCKSLWC